MNSFIKANFMSLTRINVLLFTDRIIPNNANIKIFKDDIEISKPHIVKRISNGNLYIFDLEIAENVCFASRYSISILDFPLERIDVSNATEFPEFDSLFNYSGDDLGCTYSKEETTFAVWTPLATAVTLKIESEEENKFVTHRMTRTDDGVYRLTLKGDYLNRKYRYRVEENGVKRETNDIYGIATSLNSLYSVVVDKNEVNNFDFVNANTKNELLDSIIYEVGVRDFTEYKHTDIVNKGKYLGFVEPNRKTKGGNPAGLDYLKYLGVTHVQLNPILDFRGVDDIKVKESYNWGYDPISLFAIEGSYSSHPEDAMARIREFQTMVNELHKNNIRVIVDVVYNHIYEYQTSALEKTAPRYFFRRKKNGEISSSSGCGNDIASERPMARKIIVDSAKHLVKTYNIDGFRFDLMGLLDVDTLAELENECLKIKKDLIFYGEGWNMPVDIPFEKKACCENANSIPNFAFFNDAYRDFVKGPTFSDRLYEKGYINGNVDYHFGADFAFHGGIVNHSYHPKFTFAHQSINYVECHDNHTLYDKLCESNKEESENTILNRICLANAFVMFSFGVPFYHMGQEIGLSKEGHGNTYNEVKINNMNWKLVDERFEMVSYLRSLCEFRKNLLPYTRLDNREDIDSVFTVNQWDNGVLCFYSENEKLLKDYKKLMILVNPTNNAVTYNDGNYWTVMSLYKDNAVQTKNGLIRPTFLQAFYMKGEK